MRCDSRETLDPRILLLSDPEPGPQSEDDTGTSDGPPDEDD